MHCSAQRNFHAAKAFHLFQMSLVVATGPLCSLCRMASVDPCTQGEPNFYFPSIFRHLFRNKELIRTSPIFSHLFTCFLPIFISVDSTILSTKALILILPTPHSKFLPRFFQHTCGPSFILFIDTLHESLQCAGTCLGPEHSSTSLTSHSTHALLPDLRDSVASPSNWLFS